MVSTTGTSPAGPFRGTRHPGTTRPTWSGEREDGEGHRVRIEWPSRAQSGLLSWSIPD